MSQNGLPPPPPPACLIRPYASSQKGGTLIAEDVTDRAAHERRLCDPDGYRPAACPTCGHDRLYVHDYRDRTLRDEDSESGAGFITIVRHRCPACEATWRILPRFLARFLWRSWAVVEQQTVVAQASPMTASKIPPRTRARWRARLMSTARHLVAALATSGSRTLAAVVHAIGLDATREELVLAYAAALEVAEPGRVAALAALVHRLAPGLRVV